MATRYYSNIPTTGRGRANFIVPILIIFAIVTGGLISFVWIDNEMGSLMQGFYLLPWVCLAGICVLAPSAYLLYQGKFDLFHPLVFAAWSYVFPAYVLGGVIIAFGWVNP